MLAAEPIELALAFHTPNPNQPPTGHTVKHVRLRLLVHHRHAIKGILQIELQLIKPVGILTSSLVISYSALMDLPYPVPPALGQALHPTLG